MDHMVARERDLAIDIENSLIESCGTTSEEECDKDPLSVERREKGILGRIWGGVIQEKENISSSDNVLNSSNMSIDDIESLLSKNSEDGNVALLEKKREKEKCKKTGSRKASKPPRPPKGPSLDVVDQKLVKKISELAMSKHARVERMRERKKKKAGKSTSSSSSLFALLITILFILVIIFQDTRNMCQCPCNIRRSYGRRYCP